MPATRTATRSALWLTEELPGHDLGGGSIRQARLFEAMAQEFATDLWVVGELEDERVRDAAARVVELPKGRALWSDRRLMRRLLQIGLAFASRLPGGQIYFARPGRRALAGRLRESLDTYDLVIVQHEALAPLVPRRRAARWVLDLHNLVSTMIGQEKRLARHFWQRWLLASDERKARALERRSVEAYDRVLVCSEEDAAPLRRLQPVANEKLTVVPNGVDLEDFRVTPIPNAPRVLFPGTLAYPPNVDGARWLCTDVLPRVREAIPRVEVDLVGRDPVPEVLELGTLPNVSIHADVPSMAPYFEAARLVVVPLRVGSGTRLKALEAMASGRPVVGTTIGLEGIGIVDGKHALIADEPDALAAAIGELLADDERSRRLGAAGRAHVERHFGWNAISERFVATLTESLGR